MIVNITSLCGIAPFETHGLYCMGKAAREMHHRVLAQEQAPCSPRVRVLQYSPGPMDTGMQTTIRESPAVFEGLAKKYGEMKANVRALVCWTVVGRGLHGRRLILVVCLVVYCAVVMIIGNANSACQVVSSWRQVDAQRRV